MIRNIKALGLAFVALAAMSMAVVSVAQASKLDVSSTNATITGQQTEQHNFKLTNSGAETKCTEATFEGTVTGTSAEELTIVPTYTGCKTAGLNSQVLLNGCEYTVTNKNSAGVTKALTAYIDVAGCTSGKSIEIKLTGCTVTVPEQTGLGHITFANSNPVSDVNAQITVQGIKYEFHGIACPAKPEQVVEVTKLTSDGDYTGTATFRAFADGGPGAQITHNGHQYQKLVCGAQVTLTAT